MFLIAEGKTNLVYLLIIIILVSIIGGGILVYQFLLAPKEESKMSEVKLPEMEVSEGISSEKISLKDLSSSVLFDEFSQIVNSSSDLIISEPPLIDKTSYFVWKTNDGWYIRVGEKIDGENLYLQRLRVFIPLTSVNTQEKIIENPTIRKLQEMTSELLFKKGLVVNSNNSITLLTSEYELHLFGFQGSGLRCQTGTSYSPYSTTLDSNSNGAIDWVILCVTDEQFRQAYQEQIPFLPSISSGEAVTVIPIVIIEDFAYLVVSPVFTETTPYRIIMKRKKNFFEEIFRDTTPSWEEIFRGIVPSCDLMQQHSIPKIVYQSCLP